MKNITSIDRFLRLLLAVLLAQAGFFWLAGTTALVAYALAAILLLTSAIGFCPLYRAMGVGSQRNAAPHGLPIRLAGVALLLAVALGGSYASNFFSRKLFLEEFNAMNHFYKQTLFLTGKGEREKAIANYGELQSAYQKFQDKYTTYQPLALRSDPQLVPDLARVGGMLQAVNEGATTGDLQQTHLALEKVRPVFQELFKRNGFSMLAVTLVDFHDAMELLLDAAHAKDAAKLNALYPQVDEKLKAVEAEAQDEQIQAIRANMDALRDLASAGKQDALSAQAELLKSSFVKVYLQRG